MTYVVVTITYVLLCYMNVTMRAQKMVYSELSSVDDHNRCFELLQQVPRQERYTLYEDCRKHCTQVLYAHWDLVALIAQRLLKEKKLERQELELLWQTYGKKDGMDHEDDRKGGQGHSDT